MQGLSTDHPIVVAWQALSAHAAECAGCAVVVERLRRVPDDAAEADAELHDRLCAMAQPLHIAWTQTKAEWIETTLEHRRRLGILGADQDAVELRDAAWARVPEVERRRILALPDAERFRTLEALEAAILAQRRGEAVPAETGRPTWHRPGGARRRTRLEATE